MEDDDDLITTQQAADLAGVGYQAIYYAAKLGKIPYQLSDDPARRNHGGGPVMLYHRADVEAYIQRVQARKRQPPIDNAERQRRYQERQRKRR